MPRVLIVDDLAENMYYLEALLKGNGYQVDTARNGKQALESARNSPPDLVVSDILMPVMDGYTLCREWRADQRLARIPFLFYTATYTESKDEALAYSLGADRFVIKPQEPGPLMEVITELLAASREGGESMPAGVTENEAELLKAYNATLFYKLEKKMADLERANQELKDNLIEKKRLEEQLRHAQKMEAIGRFSAGVAHDFNNILTVIIGFGTVMQMHMAPDNPQSDRLKHILAAADRATGLARALLIFSSKQEMKLQRINLNDCIKNAEVFLRKLLGEDVSLTYSFEKGVIPIVADCGHMEQVLMNLAANARDAMPDGGSLTISTDIVDIDDAFVEMHGYGTPGRHALLTVADNGIGMSTETCQLIFEPFFTTKDAGKGTGLGLSITYGIVQQHKGYISVYSEPGKGSCFRILLPLLEVDTAGQDAELCQHPLRGGSETILVVDDEPAIREYLDQFLAGLGYRVLSAQDGEEAVQLFRATPQEIDLVLMDIVMPNKTGNEAALEMRRIRGDVKIIFTSGYQYDLIHDKKLLDEGEQLLMKPLVPAEIAMKLRVALEVNAGN